MNEAPVDQDRRDLLMAGAGLLLPVRLLQSLRLSRCAPEHHGAPRTLHDLTGFETRDFFTAFGKKQSLWVKGPADGPPVLLLHELPGLTREDVDLAYRLAEAGLRVYLPLLFGKPYDNAFKKHFFGECAFGRWPWDAKTSLNPWVAPLSTLCDQIHQETNRPMGVIGMCLTGIIPVSLLANPHVVAPVLCQPTLPFPLDGGRKRAVGLTVTEIAQAKKRLSDDHLSVLAYRITTDCFCPHDRFTTLTDTFGGAVETHEIEYPKDRHGHSVLAAEFHENPAAVGPAFDRTVAFLRGALGGRVSAG